MRFQNGFQNGVAGKKALKRKRGLNAPQLQVIASERGLEMGSTMMAGMVAEVTETRIALAA
jgi:hypothetical protein